MKGGRAVERSERTTDGRPQPQATELFAGDVAASLGIGVQTLHYYEREKLIPAPTRSAGGYRLYTTTLVARVAFIKKAQALGLPLEEIRQILTLADQGSSPCGRVERALGQQLADVDVRLAELAAFRAELAQLVTRAHDMRTTGTAQVCAIVEDAAPLAMSTNSASGSPLARKQQSKRRS